MDLVENEQESFGTWGAGAVRELIPLEISRLGSAFRQRRRALQYRASSLCSL